LTEAPRPEVLSVQHASLRRDGTRILHDVSVVVRRGEHWALLGPNGAGKSTLLGLCGALIHPTTGVVHVLGERLGRVELQRLRQRIGHVNPRHAPRSALTVREVVLTGVTGTVETPPRWKPSPEEADRADDLIDRVGLSGVREQAWPTLSQGERGRALIARALVCDPELLLLDEPSTGLDVAAREQLLDTIDHLAAARPALTSVLVTHHLEELPVSTTHALLLAAGRVVAAGPIHTAVTTATVSAAFGHPIDVSYQDGRWSARSARRRPALADLPATAPHSR
jgi:iron complex transport system ATP-binding protein